MHVTLNQTSRVRPEGHIERCGSTLVGLALASLMVLVGTAVAASRGRISYTATYATAGLTVAFTAGTFYFARRSSHLTAQQPHSEVTPQQQAKQCATIQELLQTNAHSGEYEVIHYCPEGQEVVETGDGRPEAIVTTWVGLTEQVNRAIAERRKVYVRSAQTACYVIQGKITTNELTAVWSESGVQLQGDSLQLKTVDEVTFDNEQSLIIAII
jgi:hypothetical protein